MLLLGPHGIQDLRIFHMLLIGPHGVQNLDLLTVHKLKFKQNCTPYREKWKEYFKKYGFELPGLSLEKSRVKRLHHNPSWFLLGYHIHRRCASSPSWRLAKLQGPLWCLMPFKRWKRGFQFYKLKVKIRDWWCGKERKDSIQHLQRFNYDDPFT